MCSSRGGNVLKIADWGLARGYHPRANQRLTGGVITLWYRPQELLLGARKYGAEADMWSVGCLVAEIALRDALLKGDSEAVQLDMIHQFLGSPTGAIKEKFDRLPNSQKVTVSRTYPPGGNKAQRLSRIREPEFTALAESLLCMDGETRPTAAQALTMPVFSTTGAPEALQPDALEAFTVKDIHEFDVKEQVRGRLL